MSHLRNLTALVHLQWISSTLSPIVLGDIALNINIQHNTKFYNSQGL